MLTQEAYEDCLGYVVRSCRVDFNIDEFIESRMLKEYILYKGAHEEDLSQILSQLRAEYDTVITDEKRVHEYTKRFVNVKKDIGCTGGEPHEAVR